MRTRIVMECPCGARFKGGRYEPMYLVSESRIAHDLAEEWAKQHAPHGDQSSAHIDEVAR